MDNLKLGISILREPRGYLIEHTKRTIFGSIYFKVPIDENIFSMMETVANIYENILIINHKIDKLYKDSETYRVFLKTNEEYLRMYKDKDIKIYDSFIQYAGTMKEVEDKIVRYTNRLKEIYEIPKAILEKEKEKLVIEFHRLLTLYGWRAEHELSIKLDTVYDIYIKGAY